MLLMNLLSLHVLRESGGRCWTLPLCELRLMGLLETSFDPLTFVQEFSVSRNNCISASPAMCPQLCFFLDQIYQPVLDLRECGRRIGSQSANTIGRSVS
jgi:hypothetical protein